MLISNYTKLCFVFILSSLSLIRVLGVENYDLSEYESLEKEIELLFNDAKIPGLSFVLIDENKSYFKNFGYADKENEIIVSPNTLFELGSTSKAFTALAILKLDEDHLIDIAQPVSFYIPGLRFYYKKEEVQVSLKQLLYHTSGIPFETLDRIPAGEGSHMLENTIMGINNLDLKNAPGTKYEYATINYDILGLVIEKVTSISFDEFMKVRIFEPLEMQETMSGRVKDIDFAKGYKISYGKPREYDAPNYQGNNPAGYIISNTNDLAKWLKYQIGMGDCSFHKLIERSHQPDFTVYPDGNIAYAFGWRIDLFGGKKIYHTGENPNYTSFIGFLPEKKIGFALLANSNSNYTSFIGQYLLKKLNNEDVSEMQKPTNTIDNIFSVLSIILLVLLAGIFIFFISTIKDVLTGKKVINNLNQKGVAQIAISVLYTLPFIFGIYLFPHAIFGISWGVAKVWGPDSFIIACFLIVLFVFSIWLLNALTTIILPKNKYYKSIPIIIILSVISGLSNMVIILILINAIGHEGDITYLLFYFILAFTFYIAGRKYVQIKLTKVSLSIVYNLRMKLINKIFLSSFQVFEKIDNGRIYTTLNQDTNTISNSVNILISLITNIITIIGVFIFLGTISVVATLVILIIIACVAIMYFIVSRKANVLFEQARDTQNIFSGLIDDMLYGFKELSLSNLKKKEFSEEMEASCAKLKNKTETALIKFVNAFLIGESLLICVLGGVSFLIPFMFPEIPRYGLLSFIMVIIYLIGPINAVLNALPNIMQIKVSWKRIQEFIEEIKPDLANHIVTKPNQWQEIETLSVNNLIFEYKNENEENNFKVGPINISIHKGEIIFIIGGNGSGKSTLANLITGLYKSDQGTFRVNGEKIDTIMLGEKYSAIFSNNHLFKRLYGIETESKQKEIDHWLTFLRLDDKVKIINDRFSTVALSNGQRKRLSLMKCFLENSQIYLFDEWAADQDPEYKKIFYHELLPAMKAQGKIIIAITHDDNYFDVADKIVKIDNGKMEELKYNKILMPENIL